MFIQLHVVEQPPQPQICFSTYIDHAANCYGIRREGVLGRELQTLADKALSQLRSYRQRTNGMGNTKFTTTLMMFHITLQELVMSAKKPTKPITTNTPGNLTFLNMRLTDEQLAEFDALKITPAQILNELNSALLSGFRFSFSYNPDKKTANAMLTDTRPESATHLHALSAYSDDCADALKLLMYKHSAILSHDWSSLVEDKPAVRKRG